MMHPSPSLSPSLTRSRYALYSLLVPDWSSTPSSSRTDTYVANSNRPLFSKIFNVSSWARVLPLVPWGRAFPSSHQSSDSRKLFLGFPPGGSRAHRQREEKATLPKQTRGQTLSKIKYEGFRRDIDAFTSGMLELGCWAHLSVGGAAEHAQLRRGGYQIR